MSTTSGGGLTAVARHARTPLNRQQIVGFWAAWFGWLLDGMDSVIYALFLIGWSLLRQTGSGHLQPAFSCAFKSTK